MFSLWSPTTLVVGKLAKVEDFGIRFQLDA